MTEDAKKQMFIRKNFVRNNQKRMDFLKRQ